MGVTKLYRFSLVLMMSLLISCGTEVIYEETVLMDTRGWHKDEPAKFLVEIADTSRVIDMGLTFTHTESYPYSNLWLFLTIDGPDHMQIIDTLELFLAEPSGKWLGKKKRGNYEISALYQHEVKMAHPGDYQFSVVHGMRRESLPHLKSIGLWVQAER